MLWCYVGNIIILWEKKKALTEGSYFPEARDSFNTAPTKSLRPLKKWQIYIYMFCMVGPSQGSNVGLQYVTRRNDSETKKDHIKRQLNWYRLFTNPTELTSLNLNSVMNSSTVTVVVLGANISRRWEATILRAVKMAAQSTYTVYNSIFVNVPRHPSPTGCQLDLDQGNTQDAP